MKKLLLGFLLLISTLAYSQNNGQFKGIFSFNTSDSAFIQATRDHLELNYGHTGGLFYNKQLNKWRAWSGVCPDTSHHNGCWVDLLGGSSAPALVTNANNGTHLNATIVQLGGPLNQATNITGNFPLRLQNTDTLVLQDANFISNHSKFQLFVGWQNGNKSATGIENVSFGSRSMRAITTGASNTSLGDEALRDVITGSNNTAVGSASLRPLTSGQQNTAVGEEAGSSCTSCTLNTFIGYWAGLFNNASFNTVVGRTALKNNASGSENTIMGFDAYQGSSTGSDNTVIGSQAGSAWDGSHNVLLGYKAGFGFPASSNKLFIAAFDSTVSPAPLMRGDFANNRLGIGIAGHYPTATLELPPNTISAKSAPLKLGVGGVLMGTPEEQAIESTNTHIYWTDHSGTRYQLDQQGGGGGDMILASVQTSTATKTFQGTSNNAGINIDYRASDPLAPNNGEIWINSSSAQAFARIGGNNILMTSIRTAVGIVGVDFPNTAPGAQSILDVGVTPCFTNDGLAVTPSTQGFQGGVIQAYINTNNNVRFIFTNTSGAAIDPVSMNFQVRVFY